ncbi:hypothetical protein [Mesorhizobium sp. B2-4-12]|uniref:hypothetical protein n=1 Tax=Mesorhizobium sp. B2-4-12 TaxID=2589937 RepID=UPI0015E46881|nr:hypothetical protein [Mesorhizobium sp. B2-4-12]
MTEILDLRDFIVLLLFFAWTQAVGTPVCSQSESRRQTMVLAWPGGTFNDPRRASST